MSKRNVSYVKPAEPKFLAELKAEIGYKEGPTVDTKREINPEISDEENCEKDEEQPVVVVLGPGDLTAEEVAQLVSKKSTDASNVNDKVPADGRILFRRPVKREAPKESSKAEERMKERRKKVKGVKNSSLLSFGEDDEDNQWRQKLGKHLHRFWMGPMPTVMKILLSMKKVSGEVNNTYDTMDVPIYSFSPSVVDGDLLTKKGSEDIEAMQPESCKAAEVPMSQLDSLRELGSEVPSSLEESCVLQTETELKDDVTRTDCLTISSNSVVEKMDVISSNSVVEKMDVIDSCEKDTVSFISQSDSSLASECKETTIDCSSMTSRQINDENPINVDETVNEDDSGKTSKSEEFSDESTATKLESENSDKRENQVDDIFTDKDGDKSDATSTPTTPVSKKNKKSPVILNVSPRRSSRNLNKQKSYVIKEDDDLDVQVLSPVDPLGDPLADPLNESATARDSGNKENKTHKKTTIIVNDTKTLADIAAGSKDGKKEPTLVIIDTNSILSGRGPVPVSSALTSSTSSGSSSSAAYSVLPVAVPAQGFYSQNQTQNPAHYVSIPKAHHNYLQTHYYQSHPANAYPYHVSPHQQHYHHLNTNSSSSGSSILHPPSLTDDMYVVEAPSFIVPYVYEKPSKKPLKDYLEAMAKELNITRDKNVTIDNKSFLSMKSDPLKGQSQLSSDISISEERDICNEGEKGDLTEKEDKDKKPEIESKENSNNDESVGVVSESGNESDVKSSKKVSDNIEIGGNKDKTIDSTDSGTINNNEIMQSDSGVNEMTDPLKLGSKDDNSLKATKHPNSYFDSPIGQFFMEIGANLVQECVQTDLLRMQKRKLNREGGKSAVTQFSINSLLKNLKCSKENNKSFHFDQLECEYCNFKTESSLVMAHHLECPHMKNYVYNCNFCSVVTRSPQNLLFHMEAEHNIRGRLEKIPAFHQCPNCPFEDCQKSKLTRHIASCQKKYQPDRNLEPPTDWEPPAKIPRIPRSRPPTVPAGYGIPGMAVPKISGMPMQGSHSLLPKLVPSPATLASSHAAAAAAMAMRGRGVRPASLPNRYIMDFKGVPRPIAPVQRYDSVSGLFYRPNSQVLLPTPLQIAGNQVYQVVGGQRQVMPLMADGGMPSVQCLTLIPTAGSSTPSEAPTPVALMPNIAAGSNSITIQNAVGKLPPSTKLLQQPSISITPLPRQSAVTSSSASGIHGSHHAASSTTHNPNMHNQLGNKAAFVICEICDGYIKDLEQLRNHMQWIHKVKIHPKMIYNRPPLNCQKCQFRFFTDQGLERHLLGSHGLVTSSLQEAANKGMDGGRCPVCVDRVFQWKLLNHVARAHNLTLKPAHLSYKCTVCTATFGMYKQFENHVYSAHSVGPKRGISEKKPGLPVSNMSPGQQQSTMPSSSSGSHRSSQHADNLLKPLKINDEITIIPQPPASVGQLLVPGPCPGTSIFKTGASSGSTAARASPSATAENGDDPLTAVKEKLRLRKNLEISQVDSRRRSDFATRGDPLAVTDTSPLPSKVSRWDGDSLV